jgi:hypothetical protein
MSSEHIAKGVDIDCLVVQELDDAIAVLRPVHAQCGRDGLRARLASSTTLLRSV